MSLFNSRMLMIADRIDLFGNAVLNRFLANDIDENRATRKKQNNMHHEF